MPYGTTLVDAITSSGSLAITGNTNISGNAAITGNTTISGNATVTGVLTANGSIVGSAATPTALGLVYADTDINTSPWLTSFGYNAGAATTGANNTYVGMDAGRLVSSGANNTFIGAWSGDAATTANNSIGIGVDALGLLTNGRENIGIGTRAGLGTTLSDTVAIGYLAVGGGGAGSTASGSTGVGWSSLTQLTNGQYNTAIGWQTLNQITTGTRNSAVGMNGISGGNRSYTSVVGAETFGGNGAGSHNSGVGYRVGTVLTTGGNNAFFGTNAGSVITTGSNNIILGSYTGNSGGLNIITGNNYVVLSDGQGNIRLTIDNNGNTGVGIVAPTSNFHVTGTANVSANLTIGAGSAAAPSLTTAGDNNTGMFFPAADTIAFTKGGTEALRIDVNNNIKIGGTADRATTVGTNQLVIFNGTAPVGTLANGVSLYSTAGECRVMDAAGNATLISPHDHVTNEWIFYSKHTPTGKVLKIDVEKLLRFINNKYGLDMIQEFIEE